MISKDQKRKGKSETILDVTDYEILRMLSIHKRLTITALRNLIGLTHANLTTHLKRLDRVIDRKRDQQTIHLSINKGGKIILNLVDDYFPFMKLRLKKEK